MTSRASVAPTVGCVTCRHRRKKCDQRKPTCKACERNILICVYPQNAVGDAGPSHKTTAAELQESRTSLVKTSPSSHILSSSRGNEDRRNSLQQLRRTPNQILSLTRPESSFLHDHYLNRTARMLSATYTGQNPFVKVLLPLAAWSDMILQGVLALSGVHFESQKPANHLVATYEHLAQALRGLKYGLTRFVSGQTDLALELLVTTLLFCFIECVRGDTDGNAFLHLNAARHLFPSILQDMALTKTEPETISFLLEYYTYILSLSSFSLPSNPDAFLANDVELAFEAVSRFEKPMTGMLLGCAHELFTVIPYAMTGPDDGDFETSQFCHIDASTLRQKVLSWSPPQKYSQNWIAAGRLYQLAILLLLEDRIRNPESYRVEETSHTYICDFVTLLQTITVGSTITTTLCWPLAVAGSYAYTTEHQRVINQYLTEMIANYGFGNLSQLQSLLHNVWDNSSRESEKTDTLLATMKKQGLTRILLA
ncbi:C6 zinc finger domain protein [Fusarium tjaetaba]|uniref:C6 zinc finger domain protein n=1 Tax=Fusarium tjaetaba TaxID=1567544 RepID=A0A8H5QGQ8_9HYPO|nr:C6 zinc finger domain protein [Fusarium tjaetaba]KAF5615596.1 C6 zinc finger domain protein [Fusarium tjaetaba]